jgi:trehalose/maltose transport system substrate-binding protein
MGNLVALGALGLGLALALAAPAPARAAEVAILCGPQPDELRLCREGAEDWARRSGNTVRVLPAPERSDERYFHYLDLLDRRDPGVDVLQIDVVWPGALAAHLADLGPGVPAEALAAHLPGLVANDTVGGRLVAVPWFADAGLLYYRKDLLEAHGVPVPETWGGLGETALAVQEAERAAGHGGLWGLVFQGAPYEGLTCDALEWIAAYGGGTILGADGEVAVDNPRAAFALGQVAAWVGTVVPPRALRFNEEDARRTFQLGDAVFMRNWPYAWALLNAADSPVRGKVGVAPLPRGGADGRRAATLGGWQLAVSRYSGRQAEALDLVLHLTGAAEQKRRAVRGAFAPTIRALYDDPEVLAANPFLRELGAVLEGAVARPAARAGARYAALSTQFWEAAHATLAGRGSAAENLAGLADRLRLLRLRAGW